MKRRQIRFVGYCMAIGLIIVLTMVLPVSCSCSSKASTTTTTMTSTNEMALASIAITPNPPNNLTVGSTQQFTATGSYSNGTKSDITALVTWISSNTVTATISQAGLATAELNGTTKITATLSGITSPPVPLTVVVPAVAVSSIAVTPATPNNVSVGSIQQFIATATYSDNSIMNVTSEVTWTSSNTSVATVSSTGMATGIATGTVNITASMSGIASTPVILTIIAATTSASTSAITTLTSFPYQGSGTGVWSGQITYNNKTYSVGGNLTLTIDANGAVSGSMTDSSGNSVTVTERTLQVDPNGNITGSSSFVVRGVSFTFTWQGKVTVSGNTISIQGTWTGQYGNGIFSGSGTTSS